jgi:small conductance mechanosensitive channel
VISSVTIAVLYVMVTIDICDRLGLPVGSLVAPAAVLGAALGFGAQRIVQDLLSGFFLITERQYGFGDLVELTVNGGGTARAALKTSRCASPRCALVKVRCTPFPTAKSSRP